MAKAKSNSYWKGKYIKIGDEAPKWCPSSLTTGEVKKDHQTISAKVSTKKKKKKIENKNAAPKTEDKSKK